LKPLQVVHAVLTLLLLVTVLSFGVLMLAGVVEVRFRDNAEANGGQAGEPIRRPPVLPGKGMARLVVVRGLKPNTEFPIFEGHNFVGRADQKPVDIDLEDQEPPDRIWCSRQHALITCEKGSLVIEDLNSANGTYVNRNRVPPGQKQRLSANDIIQIGAIQLKVVP
jgi:hypothetical protein